jgi:hypothetical protein
MAHPVPTHDYAVLKPDCLGTVRDGHHRAYMAIADTDARPLAGGARG